MAPVSAVTPASGRSREGQSNLGARDDSHPPTGRESQRKGAEKSGPEFQAAPLLPNKRAQDGQRAAGSPEVPDAVEQQEREAAERTAQKPPLQEVLTSVWKASAAVVDVVLGREIATSAASETSVQTAVAMPQLGSTSVSSEKHVEADFSADREQGEPVAYTEQGTSTWAALETGSLVNRKV